MQRALSIDRSPPLALSLPFFLNVPLFGLLASILAAWTGPELFTSRWHPAALALTHAWTLGVLGSAMLGSLLHILAVAANVRLALPGAMSLALWGLLSAGTLLLIMGFMTWQRWTWLLAALSLGAALAAYLGVMATALWRQRRQVFPGAREILTPVRLALTFLGLTLLSGLAMLLALGLDRPVPNLLDNHVAWGLGGWAGLLLMAMSFQLLPIFQVTELYPRPLVRWLPWTLAGLLLARWALEPLPGPWLPLRELLQYLILLSYALWAIVTWIRLWRRKRPKADVSTLFWYSALASLLACVPLGFWLNTPAGQGSALSIGILLIMGALGSAVSGMLYIIVPFLLWREAQQAVPFDADKPEQTRELLRLVPKTGHYMPQSAARRHWVLHSAAVLVWALAALGGRVFAWMAAAVLFLSFAVLAWNLWTAWRRYRECLSAIAAYAPTRDTGAGPRCPES